MTPDALPELTEHEERVLGAFDFEKVWRKIQASLPPEERRCWKVIDRIECDQGFDESKTSHRPETV